MRSEKVPDVSAAKEFTRNAVKIKQFRECADKFFSIHCTSYRMLFSPWQVNIYRNIGGHTIVEVLDNRPPHHRTKKFQFTNEEIQTLQIRAMQKNLEQK